MNKSQFEKVFLIAVAVVGFFIAPFPGAASAASYGDDRHQGEKVIYHALRGVESVDGRVLLYVGRVTPWELTPTATMNYCGQELAPNMANLTEMIGKPLVGWAMAPEVVMVFHRLEFPCK